MHPKLFFLNIHRETSRSGFRALMMTSRVIEFHLQSQCAMVKSEANISDIKPNLIGNIHIIVLFCHNIDSFKYCHFAYFLRWIYLNTRIFETIPLLRNKLLIDIFVYLTLKRSLYLPFHVEGTRIVDMSCCTLVERKRGKGNASNIIHPAIKRN